LAREAANEAKVWISRKKQRGLGPAYPSRTYRENG